MVFCTQMYGVMLMALLLHMVLSTGATAPACSWGSWLPWNCSCCGNSEEQTIYKVRAQCCAGTSECKGLRIMETKINSTGNGFRQSGKCSDHCDNFYKFNGNRCTVKMPSLEDITWSDKTVSCPFVCIGTMPRTVITSTTTHLHPTNRVSSLVSGSQLSAYTATSVNSGHATSVDLSTGPVTAVDIMTGPATAVDLMTGPATAVNLQTGPRRKDTSDKGSPAVRLTASCRLVWGIAMAVTAVVALNYK